MEYQFLRSVAKTISLGSKANTPQGQPYSPPKRSTILRRYTHDFQPEYAKGLENIALYVNGQQAFETQLEIIDQLPDYTKLKIFTPSAQIRMKLEESLHEDTLSRVTFFDASNAPDFTVWAQDFTEGDSSVQILPLTYLGGGQRKSLNEPGNEFLFQLESSGIEIRRVPVEFGGGNVFIAKDSEGK